MAHKILNIKQLIIKIFYKLMTRSFIIILKKKYRKELKEVLKYQIFKLYLILITHKLKNYSRIHKIFIINK